MFSLLLCGCYYISFIIYMGITIRAITILLLKCFIFSTHRASYSSIWHLLTIKLLPISNIYSLKIHILIIKHTTGNFFKGLARVQLSLVLIILLLYISNFSFWNLHVFLSFWISTIIFKAFWQLNAFYAFSFSESCIIVYSIRLSTSSILSLIS